MVVPEDQMGHTCTPQSMAEGCVMLFCLFHFHMRDHNKQTQKERKREKLRECQFSSFGSFSRCSQPYEQGRTGSLELNPGVRVRVVGTQLIEPSPSPLSINTSGKKLERGNRLRSVLQGMSIPATCPPSRITQLITAFLKNLTGSQSPPEVLVGGWCVFWKEIFYHYHWFLLTVRLLVTPYLLLKGKKFIIPIYSVP